MENPYAAPQAEIELPTGPKAEPLTWKQILFSFKGRIPRRTYWGYAILVGVINLAITLLVFGLDVQKAQTNAGYFVLEIPFWWVSAAIGIKRWQDRDKSAAWYLMVFVPSLLTQLLALTGGLGGIQVVLSVATFVGALWMLIECGCLRGTIGTNKYGEDPT